MHLFARFRRPRHLAALSFLCAGLALAGCMGDEDMVASGSPFSQALFRDYTDLATQADAAPAPQAIESDDGFFSEITSMFDSGPANPAEAVAQAFREKANRAAAGEEPAPEPAPAGDTTIAGVRARLVRAVAQGKEAFPDQAARAQADFDCWILGRGAANLNADAQACRTAFSTSLVALENAGRPAPARPAPVTTAPVAPPPPADYTVYYDLDSWTLTAEDLAVITNVINTARAGGQSHITVVGHTDTSGSTAYNQRLSVHRATVVTEALVDLGARRAAIQASGVGETDLAVPTEDGVKEARNRRAVISLQP